MFTERFSVVIVESQPLMRSALTTALAAEGMTVLAVLADNMQVMQTASNLTPDLILFSVAIPDWDDLKVISDLRRELPCIWIVALVTGEASGQEQAALEYGAHVVLDKSTSRSELLKALNHLKQVPPNEFSGSNSV